MQATKKYSPDDGSLITLVPTPLVQFLDFRISGESWRNKKWTFWIRQAESTSSELVPLDFSSDSSKEEAEGKMGNFCVSEIEEDRESNQSSFLEKETGRAIPKPKQKQLCEVKFKDIEHWFNQWVPIPIFRETNSSGEGKGFDKGPSNWARAFLTPGEKEDSLNLTIILDSQVEDEPSHGDVLPGLTQDCLDHSCVFSLATEFKDLGWFLNEGWVGEWLEEIWDNSRKKKNQYDKRAEEYPESAEMVAFYLAFLSIVKDAWRDKKIRFVQETDNYVDVDLVLDLGNSRSVGFLVEKSPNESKPLEHTYFLSLRDLNKPSQFYKKAFETRLEFAKPFFGNNTLSLKSGRKKKAFLWPSLARIGKEALRLGSKSQCASGTTGLSSPKRYLWSEDEWNATWRFNNSEGEETKNTEEMVQDFSFAISDSGVPLSCCDDDEPRYRGKFRANNEDLMPLFESKFSRSSMMMQFFMEILVQALSLVNSYGQRKKGERTNRPRRLRNIIIPLPTGMSVIEQNIFKRWVEFGIRAVWESLGWQDFYWPQRSRPEDDGENPLKDFRCRPEVNMEWDEATCTQLLYLYNEIMWKFNEKGSLFFDLNGRKENFGASGDSKPLIRIASVDIGGGTTDLSINSYILENDESSTLFLKPRSERKDGFNLAGDDVLKRIINKVVFGSLEKYCGPGTAKVLDELFGSSKNDSDRREKNKRTSFLHQVAIPAAHAILELYEKSSSSKEDFPIGFKLGDLFYAHSGEHSGTPVGLNENPLPPSLAIIGFFEEKLKEEGVPKPDFLNAEIRTSGEEIDSIIEELLRVVIGNICQVVRLSDCDVLLLTGRPSQWREVKNTFLSYSAVPPHHFISMKNYKVAGWNPISDHDGNITDPKTTVVCGAILGNIAQTSSIHNFGFDAGALISKSTARFIGEIKKGILENKKIWFTVETENNEDQSCMHQINLGAQISIGFRREKAEYWPASPLYLLGFSEENQKIPGKLPYKVELELTVEETNLEPGRNDLGREEGEIEIVNIEDAAGDDIPRRALSLRLFTLKDGETNGFWMDSGEVRK